jgi:septal ring factor EnvC (AmiA/AmiB activator)
MSDLEWTTKAWHEAEDRARKLQARVNRLEEMLKATDEDIEVRNDADQNFARRNKDHASLTS